MGSGTAVDVPDAVPDPGGDAAAPDGDAAVPVAPSETAPTDASPAGERAAAGRLLSVDVLRGVSVAGMLLVEQLPGDAGSTWHWLRHAPWNGWTGADLVFPGFLFVVGMSLALSLRGPWDGATARRLLRRFVVLVAVGLVFNAWGASRLDLGSLRLPGVLQRIALAGLVGAIVVLTARRWWIVLAVALAALAGYGLVLTHAHTACGQGTLLPHCNIAGEVDRHVFGAAHLYQGGAAGYDPEGLLSILGALATVLFGWLGARLVMVRPRDGWTVVAIAGAAGACLVASGHLWQNTPINKRLWTPPFSLFTAALFLGGFAVAFALFELTRGVPVVGRAARGLAWPWAVFGRNALVVYVGQHVVGGNWVPARFVAAHWSGDAVLLAHAVIVLLAWWVVAATMHALRWYVTV